MSRISKGARLVLDKSRRRWVIQDGQTRRGTRCHERDRATAERKLAEYIIGKRDPAQEVESTRDPNQAEIADVLHMEMKRITTLDDMPNHRKRELVAVCERVGNWFGKRYIRFVGELSGKIQRLYIAERGAPSAATRDLKILAAAINRNVTEEMGGAQTKFRPAVKANSDPRERWLTRDEAAKMIWAAWRARKGVKNPGSLGRHTSRHIARFILVGVYTGSRKGDICGAALMPTVGRGYIDIERGIFRRKPENKKATSKQQPTVPIPPKLLAHLRRWKRLGISKNAVVEFNGKPVSEIRAGFKSVVEMAGLATDVKKDKVIPHSLRHTAITWYLRDGVNIELVSQYCGVSEDVIRKHYRHEMPGQYNELLGSTRTFGRT